MKKPEQGDTQKLGLGASLVTTVCAPDALECAHSPTVRTLSQYKPWAGEWRQLR